MTAIPIIVPSTPFKTILNFRDVGQTINLLTSTPLLREGLLFRSARPDEASPQDRDSLQHTYKIHTVIDLRSTTELIDQAKRRNVKNQSSAQASQTNSTATEPVKIPGLRYEEINLNGTSFSRALLWKLGWGSMAKLFGLVAAGYRIEAIGILGREVMAPRGLIGLGKDSLDYSRGEIYRVFSVLADKDCGPVLVHCTQGKDRTGLVVILLLLLWEVPVKAIKADYVASENELEPEKEERIKEIMRIGLGDEFAGCPTGFVEEMEAYLLSKYGGATRYLDTCGVHEGMRATTRARFLN